MKERVVRASFYRHDGPTDLGNPSPGDETGAFYGQARPMDLGKVVLEESTCRTAPILHLGFGVDLISFQHNFSGRFFDPDTD